MKIINPSKEKRTQKHDFTDKPPSSVKTLISVFETLQAATFDLSKVVKKQSEDKEAFENRISKVEKAHSEEKVALEKRIRENEDDLDDFRQKNLRGKFIITTTAGKASTFKTSDMLAAEGGSKALATHIINLAKTKYAVDLTENDIDSCHYLPKGGIFFSLWNHRPSSVCEQLNTNIKKGLNKDINVFFNFMLTKRRSSILYEVRQLKKQTQIARYYSDEDGCISIKVKDSGSNLKLTSFYKTKTSPLRTFKLPELLKRVSEMQPQ